MCRSRDPFFYFFYTGVIVRARCARYYFFFIKVQHRADELGHFITPWVEALVMERGQIGHIGKMHEFSFLFINYFRRAENWSIK